jgi:hypothetical protein
LVCVIQIQVLCQECMRDRIIAVVGLLSECYRIFSALIVGAKETYQVNMRYMQMR